MCALYLKNKISCISTDNFNRKLKVSKLLSLNIFRSFKNQNFNKFITERKNVVMIKIYKFK